MTFIYHNTHTLSNGESIGDNGNIFNNSGSKLYFNSVIALLT